MNKVYGPEAENAAPTPTRPPRKLYFIDVAAENKAYASSLAKAERARNKASGVGVRDADLESASYISFCKKRKSNNSSENTLEAKKKPFSWPFYNRRSRAKRALQAFWTSTSPPTVGMRGTKFAVWEYTFADFGEFDRASPISAAQDRLHQHLRRKGIEAHMVRLLGAKRGTHHLIVRVPEGTRLLDPNSLWNHGDAQLSRLTCHAAKRCIRLIKATKRHALKGRGRLYDVSRSSLTNTAHRLMRWVVLPEWLRKKTIAGEVLTRVEGGGWRSESGDYYPSPWKRRFWLKPNGEWGEKFVRVHLG